MNEIVFIAASLRLPIVMLLANRSLSGPLSIWNDHTDVMSIRDCGWIQVFAENGQEVFDHVLFAFRVAEDPNVCLPVIVNVDGFVLTHMIEPLEFWDEDYREKIPPGFQTSQSTPSRQTHNHGGFWDADIFLLRRKKLKMRPLLNLKLKSLKPGRKWVIS